MTLNSAGVEVIEVDDSSYESAASSTYFAIVGTSARGSTTGVTTINSVDELNRKLGIKSTYGYEAAFQFLKEGTNLIFCRVVGTGAQLATINVNDNGTTGAAPLLRVDSTDPGSWYNDRVSVTVASVNSADKTFDLEVTVDGQSTTYADLSLDPESLLYVEEVFAEHDYVRIEDLTNGANTKLPATGTFTLSGGTDGTAVTKTEVVAAIQSRLSNPEAVFFNVVAAPGYSEADVVNALLNLASTRGDALALIDPPIGMKPTQVHDWHNGKLVGANYPSEPLDTSYGSLYWPWVLTYSEAAKKNIWTPPSGHVAGAYAYNDLNAAEWFAPAGLTRGKLDSAVDIEYSPDRSERDLLNGAKSSVNPITNFSGQGIVIYGQKTLQRAQTSLDRVNVRRMLLAVKRYTVLTTNLLVFDQNDEFTWNQWINYMEPFLRNVKARRGLYDFKVMMNAATVTSDHIDRGEMPGKIMLKPTKTAEYITIQAILKSTGATFQ